MLVLTEKEFDKMNKEPMSIALEAICFYEGCKGETPTMSYEEAYKAITEVEVAYIGHFMYDMEFAPEMTFNTASSHKREEIAKVIPSATFITSNDCNEVYGSADEVIIYKSLHSQKGIVEDTILVVDEVEIVDIKHKYKDIQPGLRAKVVISLGVKHGKTIRIYRGEVEVTTTIPEISGYGFEPYLIYPERYRNPRAKALEDLVNSEPYLVINIEDIPPWTGEYQID